MPTIICTTSSFSTEWSSVHLIAFPRFSLGKFHFSYVLVSMVSISFMATTDTISWRALGIKTMCMWLQSLAGEIICTASGYRCSYSNFSACSYPFVKLDWNWTVCEQQMQQQNDVFCCLPSFVVTHLLYAQVLRD